MMDLSDYVKNKTMFLFFSSIWYIIAIVTTLDAGSLEHIHLIIESVYTLRPVSPLFPHLPTPGNYHSTLCFSKLNIFIDYT